MSVLIGALFRQASVLDEHDRATLAGLLLESLEHEVDEEVEATGRRRWNSDWPNSMLTA